MAISNPTMTPEAFKQKMQELASPVTMDEVSNFFRTSHNSSTTPNTPQRPQSFQQSGYPAAPSGSSASQSPQSLGSAQQASAQTPGGMGPAGGGLKQSVMQAASNLSDDEFEDFIMTLGQQLGSASAPEATAPEAEPTAAEMFMAGRR